YLSFTHLPRTHISTLSLHDALPISHEGLPRDDNGSVEGFTGAVAPDGTLYVVWADGNNVAFTFSHNGGKTFAHSRSIIKTAPPRSEEHTSELQSRFDLVCRLLLEKK